MASTPPDAIPTRKRGGVGEVFLAFLKLGVTAFGGPVAHLGYFRDEFVTRRRWLDDRAYADLVALGQFLPGPASSQVGFAVGLLRAGPFGALAAFVAFTLPSALLMIALALGAKLFEGPIGAGMLTGLGIVAVAIVAQAVWGMSRALTPDRRRAAIAAAAAVVALLLTGPMGQVTAIALGAVVGLFWCRSDAAILTSRLDLRVSRVVGVGALLSFTALLVGLPILAAVFPGGTIALFDAFYRSGALVFGGGHVVLPLLQAEVVVPGWVTPEQFVAGYGAAQAMPGPLFTFAAYLGSLATAGPSGIVGGFVALIAVFLPGFLLLIGVLPFWNIFRARPRAQALMRGANAAVVGILAAALYNPVFTTAVTDAASFALALVCFVLLVAWRTPPWAVVIVGAVGGIVLTLAV
ncbi:chromate transporter [Microbacterium endophyticum]|uniref:Chromate transporter n=1 Tax=Microbacterium endophyticum TaxID=1526412 RepID=A0A7W4YPD9_9MICO|nr:chromate efflux transporter [Microbacterium endophyticum]MBB2976676.1 chromate transporter [Microbacterium endophyticum]NIK37637.1 chromate transporter [Microbacterium endophyticum]